MTDTMREKFEKWYAKQYPDPVPEYAIDEARIIKDNRWHVWQASQADARALNENLDSMHQTNQALIKKLYDALALVGELRSELEVSRTELIEAGHRFGFYFGLSEQVKGYYTDGFAKNRDDFYGFANNKNEAITKAQAFMEGK